MAKNPESVLKRLLKDKLSTVLICNERVDLLSEVALPKDVEITDLLSDHAERVLLWDTYVKNCNRDWQKAQDELDEWIGRRGHQYWQQLETQEREEMKSSLHDEDEVDKDTFKGPKSREKRSQYRAQSGLDAGRWRRNFTDDFIKSLVHSDEKIIGLKGDLRKAKARLEQAWAMKNAMSARGMALNQLCAISRDLKRS